MAPLHEVWLQVKSPAGRPAGEVLLSVDAARKAAQAVRIGTAGGALTLTPNPNTLTA